MRQHCIPAHVSCNPVGSILPSVSLPNLSLPAVPIWQQCKLLAGGDSSALCPLTTAQQLYIDIYDYIFTCQL